MQSSKSKTIVGWLTQGETEPEMGDHAIHRAILRTTHPIILRDIEGQLAVGQGGKIAIGDGDFSGPQSYPLGAYVPALNPQNLGDPGFKQAYNLRYAYVVGAMANGITSVEMVEAAGHAGMIGFFGAAGLALDKIETAIDRLQQSLKDIPFGFNLIHSPHDPALESATVDLYLRRGIRIVSTSAYLDLTLPLVYFRVKGIHTDSQGNIICQQSACQSLSS